MAGFNVVFEYTAEVKGYEGVITWTTFESEERFNEFYTPAVAARETVLAKGISDDEAERIAASTPLHCTLTAIIHEAFGHLDL